MTAASAGSQAPPRLSLLDRQVLDALGDGESTKAEVYGRLWSSVSIERSLRKLFRLGLVEDRRYQPGQTENQRRRASHSHGRLALTEQGRADHDAWKAAP